MRQQRGYIFKAHGKSGTADSMKTRSAMASGRGEGPNRAGWRSQPILAVRMPG